MNSLQKITKKYSSDYQKEEILWLGSFQSYQEKIKDNPNLIRNAAGLLYDAVLSFGSETRELGNDLSVIHYKIFDDPFNGGKDAIYGLDFQLEKIVNEYLRGAASGYGLERRILFLRGLRGSGKTTIVRLLKRGLEKFSATKAGAVFSIVWPDGQMCPIREDPIFLIPREIRKEYLSQLLPERADKLPADIFSRDLCPDCRKKMDKLLVENEGDLEKIFFSESVKIKRVLLAEGSQLGVGFLSPRNETSDIFRQFQIANRGLMEISEPFQFSEETIHAFLKSSEEREINPDNSPPLYIDAVAIAYANSENLNSQDDKAEKRKKWLLAEDVRDRLFKVQIPYNVILSEEIKIYEKDFGLNSPAKLHTPHTLETVAMFSVLNRYEISSDNKENLLVLMDQLNGKQHGGHSLTCKEIKDRALKIGMNDSLSPRKVQDKLAGALIGCGAEGCLTPHQFISFLSENLPGGNNDSQKYKNIISVIEIRIDNLIKEDVMQAIIGGDDGIQKVLETDYIPNLVAYLQRQKILNPVSKKWEEANLRLMMEIEGTKIVDRDEFRQEIMGKIGSLALEDKKFNAKSDQRLYNCIRNKLIGDAKKRIDRFSKLHNGGGDNEMKDRVDAELLPYMIKGLKYCPSCGKETLLYVANLFSREEKED